LPSHARRDDEKRGAREPTDPAREPPGRKRGIAVRAASGSWWLDVVCLAWILATSGLGFEARYAGFPSLALGSASRSVAHPRPCQTHQPPHNKEQR
jgi:hypothetical protein